MYTSYSAEDFRKYIGLLNDYSVSGLLAYGVWDLHAEDRQVPILKATLEALGYQYQLRQFDKPMIGHAYELVVHGRHYWFVPVMGTAVMSNYIHLACTLGSRINILLGVVGGLSSWHEIGGFYYADGR